MLFSTQFMYIIMAAIVVALLFTLELLVRSVYIAQHFAPKSDEYDQRDDEIRHEFVRTLVRYLPLALLWIVTVYLLGADWTTNTVTGVSLLVFGGAAIAYGVFVCAIFVRAIVRQQREFALLAAGGLGE